MKHIYEMFGDPSKIEKAIADAIPDLNEVEDLQKSLTVHKKTLDEINRQYDNLLGALAETENKTTRRKITERMDKLEDQVEAIEIEINRIETKLKNIPKLEAIKAKASLIKRQIKGYYKYPSYKYYEKMTFEDKRQLLQFVFSSRDIDGPRCGIYIERDKFGWLYDIRGGLNNDIGRITYIDDNKIKIVNKP